jgi:hypothetical protein
MAKVRVALNDNDAVPLRQLVQQFLRCALTDVAPTEDDDVLERYGGHSRRAERAGGEVGREGRAKTEGEHDGEERGEEEGTLREERKEGSQRVSSGQKESSAGCCAGKRRSRGLGGGAERRSFERG